MKKTIFYTISIIGLTLFVGGSVFAQGMPAPYFAEGNSMGMGNNMMSGSNTTTQSDGGLPADLSAKALAAAEASAQAGHTAREEAEGKAVWEKLQAKELKCEDLADDDFGALGEYFMGQMAGEQHETMNNMMIQMMGEEGEKQMHVAMGKRMSGCEPNAPMPQNMPALNRTGSSGLGMMNMMLAPYQTKGFGSGMGGSNSMMGGWGQNQMRWKGVGSWFLSLLWLVWLIVGILAAIWLWKQIVKK